MNDDEPNQLEITRFLDVNLESLTSEEQKKPYWSLTPEERKKLMNRRLRKNAKRHFEKGIRHLLESINGNSVDYHKFVLFFIRTLRKMEDKNVCYIKAMPDKRPRIFKRFYCCYDLEVWKKCPEYRCVIWPCNEETECPHHELVTRKIGWGKTS